MSASADRNLLVGILALQMDFISRDQLVTAMHNWVLDKSRPLEEILLAQGVLGQDTKALLVALVNKHLEMHEGDAEKSLGSVSSIGSLRQELKSVNDEALELTLTLVSKANRTPRSISVSMSQLPESIAGPLDALCDQFEDAWQDGRPELIEYLKKWGRDEGRCELLENLLLIELRHRRHLDERPSKDEYERQFPDDTGVIEAVFVQHRAIDPDATATYSVGQATSQGLRFRVLRPHAKGGLGQVSVARDVELNRDVALKEIQSQHAHNEDNRTRFVQEAEITGGLEHPGIVPIYGLGQYDDGRPFYAMRFIKGDSLKEAIERFHKADEKPGRDPGERALELRKLLGRFVDVCNAIEYAHSRGILHRDLKPGNIMLGKYGETLVVDWGLAKAAGRKEEHKTSDEVTLQPSPGSGSAPTQMGHALGTLGYMSPEQAAGKLDQLGPPSDVYSLGATLYCLLTGQSSQVRDSDLGKTLRRIQAGDFVPPRQAKATVSRALEAICLKAMSLRPEDRYATPSALKGDVERYLADERVDAYVEPIKVRMRRWVRRHQTVVTSSIATVIVALVCLIIGVAFVLTKNQQLVTAYTELDGKTARLNRTLNELNSSNRELGKRRTELELANSGLANQTARAEAQLLRAELAVYRSQVADSLRRWNAGDIAGATETLDSCRWDFRGWEHDYLFSLMENQILASHERKPGGDSVTITALAVSPDGKLYSAGDDHTIRCWDPASSREIRRVQQQGEIRCVAFTENRNHIVLGGNKGTLALWDLATNRPLWITRPHVRTVERIICSANDILVSSDGSTICANRGQDGRRLWQHKISGNGLRSKLTALDVGPDATSVAVGGQWGSWPAAMRMGFVDLLDLQTGKQIWQLTSLDHPVGHVKFDHAQRLLIALHEDSDVGWDSKRPWTLEVYDTTARRLQRNVLANQGIYTVDSRGHGWELTTGGGGCVQTWDVDDQLSMLLKKTEWLPGRRGLSNADLSWSDDRGFITDGRTIARYSNDGTFTLANSVGVELGFHIDRVRGGGWRLAFDGDGTRIAGYEEGVNSVLHVWDLVRSKKHLLTPSRSAITRLEFDQKGRLVSHSNVTTVWDDELHPIETRLKVRGYMPWSAPASQPSPESHLSVSSAPILAPGKELTIHASPALNVRRQSDGHLAVRYDFTVRELQGDTYQSREIRLSPRSKWLLYWGEDRELELISLSTPGERKVLSGVKLGLGRSWGHTIPGSRISFDKEENHVATYEPGETCRIWSLETGKEVSKVPCLQTVWVEFTEQGHLLQRSETRAQLWDYQRGILLRSLAVDPEARIEKLMLIPGLGLVSGGADGAIRLWGRNAGREAYRFDDVLAVVDPQRERAGLRRESDGAVDVIPDLSSPKVLQRLSHGGEFVLDTQLSFDPNGESLLAWKKNRIDFWRPNAGQHRHWLNHTGSVVAMGYSSNGSRVVSLRSDGTLRVSEANTGREIWTVKALPGDTYGGAAGFEGNEKVWHIGTGGAVQWRQSLTGELLEEVNLPHATIYDALTVPNVRLLVAVTAPERANYDQFFAVVWDLEDRQEAFRVADGGVRAIAVDPAGSRLATACHNGQLKLWSIPDGELIWSVKAQDGPCSSVVFSGDGTKLFSGGKGGAKLWGATSGKRMVDFSETKTQQRLRSDEDSHFVAKRLAVSGDGQWLAATGQLEFDGGIAESDVHLWKVDGGEAVDSMDYQGSAIAFHPDSRELLVSSGVFQGDQLIRVALPSLKTSDLQSQPMGELVDVLVDERDYRAFVAATSDNRITFWSDDGPMKRWITSVEEGARVALERHSPDGRRVIGYETLYQHELVIWDKEAREEVLRIVDPATFSSDGMWVANGNANGDVHVRRVANLSEGFKLKGDSSTIEELTFAFSDRQLITVDNSHVARSWNLSTKEVVSTWRLPDAPTAMAIDAGGQIGYGCKDGSVVIHDPTNGRTVQQKLHAEPVSSIAFSPDGRRLATTAKGEPIKLSEIHRLTTLFSLPELATADLLFSAWNQLLGKTTTLSDTNTFMIWPAPSRQIALPVLGHSRPVLDTAFHSTGEWFASVSLDRTARVWSARSGKEMYQFSTPPAIALAVDPVHGQILTGDSEGRVQVINVNAGETVAQLPSGPKQPIFDLVISADGRFVAARYKDFSVWIWDREVGGEPVQPLRNKAAFTSLAAHPDGSIIAGCRDGSVHRWTVTSTEQSDRHDNRVQALSISPDGEYLASASSTEVVVSADEVNRDWKTDVAITCLAISRDNRWLASGHLDGSIEIRKLSSGELVHRRREHTKPIRRLRFDPLDNRLLAVSDDALKMHLLDLE